MIDLRHRTRIFVPDAVCLLGIVDETGSLPPGKVMIPSGAWMLSVSVGLSFRVVLSVTICFVCRWLQVYFSSELPAGTPVLVCRNPSLHPGEQQTRR